VALSPDDQVARSPARSPAAQSVPSQVPRPRRVPAIIWRKAIAITGIRQDNTFKSTRAVAIEANMMGAGLTMQADFRLPALQFIGQSLKPIRVEPGVDACSRATLSTLDLRHAPYHVSGDLVQLRVSAPALQPPIRKS